MLISSFGAWVAEEGGELLIQLAPHCIHKMQNNWGILLKRHNRRITCTVFPNREKNQCFGPKTDKNVDSFRIPRKSIFLAVVTLGLKDIQDSLQTFEIWCNGRGNAGDNSVGQDYRWKRKTDLRSAFFKKKRSNERRQLEFCDLKCQFS